MKTFQNVRIIVIGLICTFSISGCQKLVEIDPPENSLNSINVFNNDETAITILTSQYSALSSPENLYIQSSVYSGLAADELVPSGSADKFHEMYYKNTYTAESIDLGFWNIAYSKMYGINDAIERLRDAAKLTPSVRKQLLGEAKFLRAFYYFYLTGYYGDVPLVLTTDYKFNEKIARSAKNLVFEQIENDLSEAADELSVNFVAANVTSTAVDRIRPTRWAALALLARVYLYQGKFSEAEEVSSNVIAQSSLFSLPGLDQVFLKNSDEAIWQLQPVIVNQNTLDAKFFTINDENGLNRETPLFLSQHVTGSFESDDERKKIWIGTYLDKTVIPNKTYYYPHKYKILNEDELAEFHMVLRLAEQYLIRAEARVRLSKTNLAVEDLDKIRVRAGLTKYDGPTGQSELLDVIYHERQVELFTEMGHRWFDLSRSGKMDAAMEIVSKDKNSIWASYKALLPVSREEMIRSVNITQTPGYTR